jgi:hypothetical protein
MTITRLISNCPKNNPSKQNPIANELPVQEQNAAKKPENAAKNAEIQNSPHLPERIAWMACHFSAYGKGISNMPTSLPPGAALILNDRMPPFGHDPATVAKELIQTI